MSSRDREIIQGVGDFVKRKVAKNNLANSNEPTFLAISHQYIDSKLSVLPVKDNKKPSVREWKPYQERLMTKDELAQCFSPTSNVYGIALICGQVSSGGLETLDFDNKVPDRITCAFSAFSTTVKSERPELFSNLVINSTPSGGYHIRYLCTEVAIPSNTKLAEVEYQAKGKTETITLIETRGEGGYAVAPPTPGYELIQGSLTHLPTISADDRAYLESKARQLDQVKRQPQTRSRPVLKVRQDGQQKVGDLYNQTNEYQDLLTKHKWTLEKAFGTQERWLRPDSDSDSSATFHTETRLFNVFTTNAEPLEAGGSYDPFGLLVRLDFDHDPSKAARYLYAEHPEWSIPSNGYKPSKPEQVADQAQLEHLTGLYSKEPKDIWRPVNSQDQGGANSALKARNELQRQIEEPTPDDQSGQLTIQAKETETGKSADQVGMMRQAMQDTDTSTIELMKWTPGTGKTYAAEAVAVEMAKRGQATIFAMQSNERSEQEAAAMLDRFGSQAAVIKGRNADNCTKYESAEALGKGGHSVRQSLCYHCPVRQECIESGYLSQFDGYQNGRTNVAFMPIESAVELLKDNKGSATLNADVLVFDEDPSRVAMQTHSLTIKQLDQINPSTDQVRVVIDLLSELVLSVQRYGKVLNDWSRLKDRIQSILKRFKRKGGQHAELAMDTERVMREVIGQINDTSRNLISTSPEYVEQVEPRWLANIVSELKRIITADKAINVSLVVTEERLVFRHPRTINPKAKMVVLDAYGRPELYQQVFNKEVRIHQHQVKPNMKLWHIPMNTSRTCMGNESRWTRAKWEQVIKNQTSLFEFEQMVIFVDGKEMVEKTETAVKSLGLSQKVAVDYFYRGRGTNKYQEFDAVVILGQAEPRSDVIVSETRALHRDGQYVSDKVKSNNKRQFRDPRLQQFKESRQIDEIVQCVYRIRPATHPHQLGKKVIICTGFEIEGLTDQPNVIRLGRYNKSVEAEIRRTKLADKINKHLSKYSYMTLANGLNSTFAAILGESQAGHEFLTFAYNNIEESSLISECEKLGYSKGFSASEKTVRKDLKMLVDSGQIESHRETVELDGKQYSPVVVYGSLDAFWADIDQARVVLGEREQPSAKSQKVRQDPVVQLPVDAKPTVADPEDELLPFDQDVADILEQYCISRDQWCKETIGGESVAVMFAELIDQVDDGVRAAVLEIPKPEIFSTNLALKEVLNNEWSGAGLGMLRKWAEN